MTYAFTEVIADSIEDSYCRIVASRLARNSNHTHLQSVTQDNLFLCYRSVRMGQFGAVTLFGLKPECTWQSCLEISNYAFSEMSFPSDNQRVQLDLNSYKHFSPALAFFEENGFKYEMSFGSSDPGEHDVLIVKKIEPVIFKTGLILPKILEMLGLR